MAGGLRSFNEVGPIFISFFDKIIVMYYVYFLRSTIYPDKTYVGFTIDVQERFKRHNAGTVPSTSDFKPWKLIAYVALESQEKAKDLEKYFKVGSGHAFARKRLWS